jgi:hypothetical protein
MAVPHHRAGSAGPDRAMARARVVPDRRERHDVSLDVEGGPRGHDGQLSAVWSPSLRARSSEMEVKEM